MIKTAYVQTDGSNQILNQGCYTAYYGLKKLGFSIKTFYLPHEVAEDCYLVAGGINTVRTIITNMNRPQPEIHPPHHVLPGFVNRSVRETTLGELRTDTFKPPYFIKPLYGDKLFTGFVVKHPKMDFLKLRSLDNDVQILISDVKEFVSEYRCFVMNKTLIGCKNYAGRFNVLPDFAVVQEAIEAYKEQKISYSLDFAITAEGETDLIEINDGFGIAPYGLDPSKYVKFLAARWGEIMGRDVTSYLTDTSITNQY